MRQVLRIKNFKRFYSNISPDLKFRLIAIGMILFTLNVFVWCFAFIFRQKLPVFFSLIAIAYGLGLRHAVDADHIAAIDNTTRKLVQENKKPAAVGFFFSLGHSSVVLIISLLLSASAVYINKQLSVLFGFGQLLGTLISSFFLLFIGIINLVYLIKIIKIYLQISKGEDKSKRLHEHFNKRNIIVKPYRLILKAVNSSWQMYFIGFLFGLSFDTSSEIGLLSMSLITGKNGFPVLISIFLPLAFAAGMALIDTLDGILMLGAYGWVNISPDKKLYYNITVTAISVMIALFVGSIEFLQILSTRFKSGNWFFNLINNFNLGNLGYIIIFLFIFIWITSMLIYKIRRNIRS